MRNNIHNLIGLYCYICEAYDSRLHVNVQRLRNNNRPQFTDAEVLTVYLWGLSQRLLTLRAIHEFTKAHLLDWFPDIPSYQAFARRLADLNPALMEIVEVLVEGNGSDTSAPCLLDSMPVIVGQTRRRRALRSARGLCDIGYCATKQLHYYGVKLSVLGRSRAGTIPSLTMFAISPANESDITLGREILANESDLRVFADRGYHSASWQQELALRNVILHTPPKRQRNSPPLTDAQRSRSRFISSVRQPIESFFAFLHSRFRLHDASSVRSVKGLISFVCGRLAAALLLSYPFFNP
ncbi:MAG: transposase [Synergistaceae bacterium]|nr:transposase [Synergistaceae bacterium]